MNIKVENQNRIKLVVYKRKEKGKARKNKKGMKRENK